MKYLFCIVAILIICIPQVVFAWGEHQTQVSCFMTCGYSGGRWSTSISGVGDSLTKMDAPPQLNELQAYRWRIANALSKAHLAEVYGVPKEIAQEYGAIYPEYKPWGFTYLQGRTISQ